MLNCIIEGAIRTFEHTFRYVALSILAQQMDLHFVVHLSVLIQFALCYFTKLPKAVRLHVAHEILTTFTATPFAGINAIISTLIALNIPAIALATLIEG